MCGFVVILSGQDVPPAILRTMRDRLFHRGPDDGRDLIIKNCDVTVALGQRRLSIQDPSDDAALPMQSPDKRYTLVYNGEIYNFVELRRQLEAKGHHFISHGDSEVLLHAYMEWGEECIKRLNGMYAFFIWDDRESRGFAGRDRFGEKPLYFFKKEGFIAFASEIKALVAHPEIPCSPDLENISDVMSGRIMYGTPRTLFEGIERLSPGHSMNVGKQCNITGFKRYWTPNYDEVDDAITEREAIDKFTEILLASLRTHTRSDVDGSACLSGGLDSSTLVTLLSRMDGSPGSFRLKETVSACFPDDTAVDESAYVDAVTLRTGITNRKVVPDAEGLLSEVDKLHWHHEGVIPSASMYLEWVVMKVSRQFGYKVMIDGQGADEVLGGYQYYFPYFQQDAFLKNDWRSLLSNIPPQAARLYRESFNYPNYQRRFSRDFYMPRRILARRRGNLLVDEDKYAGMPGLPEPRAGNCFRYTLASGMLYDSLPGQLHSGDSNSMAHGVETRFPLLDYDLVDWCSHLPDRLLINRGWQKYILRKALAAKLPSEVSWRPEKVGYQSPQDVWLREEMKEWLNDSVRNSRLESVPAYDRRQVEEYCRMHGERRGDYSTHLWQWASLSQFLELFEGNVWREGLSGTPPGTSTVAAVNDDNHEKLAGKTEPNPAYSRRKEWRVFCNAVYEWSPREARIYIKKLKKLRRRLIKMLRLPLKVPRYATTMALRPAIRIILLGRSFLINKLLFIRNQLKRPPVPDAECGVEFFAADSALPTNRVAWIISYTGVSNEPRVIRQARALLDNHWSVVVLGYEGHSRRPEDWNYLRLPERQRYLTLTENYLGVKRRLGRLLLKSNVKRLETAGALLIFNNIPNWHNINEQVLRFAREHSRLRPSLVISHDYHTSNVGYMLAKQSRAKFAVDCHEYSAGQYMHDPAWVNETRPWVMAAQEYFLKRADAVTTVCDGIGALIKQDYRLAHPVITVRSLPLAQPQEYKPVEGRINVLYHGDVSYIRGIHKAIKSMPLWREEFTLTVRGSGSPDYLRRLRELCEEYGVSDRVFFEDPVPFDRIIPEANKSDIGYFVHKDVSPQKRFVLPNKFFEYINGGLALCVNDLPEMAKIVNHYDLGVLVPEYDEKSIAECINSLTRGSIDAYKKASLKAAGELNWENEKQVMLDTYNELFLPN